MTNAMTFGQATVEAIQVAMDEDPSVIVVGEDIGWGGNFGQFRGLIDGFGDRRVIDMPISESLIVALRSARRSPGSVVASMSFVEFTMGAMDEIVNQASKFRYMFGGQTSVPLVLRASDGIRARRRRSTRRASRGSSATCPVSRWWHRRRQRCEGSAAFGDR